MSTDNGMLSIKTDSDGSTINIAGTEGEILFNWVALTHNVCKTLNIDPVHLAAYMPGLVTEFKDDVTRETVRDARSQASGWGGPHGTDRRGMYQ